MNEELAIGNVLFRQRRLAPDEQITRRYDTVISGLSWESRGPLALSRLKDPGESVTLLKFKSRSPDIEAAKEEQLGAYRVFLRAASVKDLDASTEAQSNFQALKAWFQDLYSSAGRPLSVLMDVTCIPKTYVLYLIALGLSDEMVARFDCLYTPGKYDLVSGSVSVPRAVAVPRSLLSEGEWHSRQIPYLEASEYIANDNDLLVTLGGELGLSLPFIERHEPRRLGLVFVKETSPSASVPMLPSERLAYEELLRVPNAQQEDIALCDALRVARHTIDFVSASKARGTTAMAIGSKPHALALGVAGLVDHRIEVVCRTPAAYRPVDVMASGNIMLYEIEDRFDPASYLSST
jgi:hypothetical protein